MKRFWVLWVFVAWGLAGCDRTNPSASEAEKEAELVKKAEENHDPTVRSVVREDGGRDIYKLSAQGVVVTKRSLDAEGEMRYVIICHHDKEGNPLDSKGYDQEKNLLFKVSYGYRKSDGQLVEKRVFDTSSKEPVLRLMYTEDGKIPLFDKERVAPPWLGWAMADFENPFEGG